jgi:hypothetical protein
MRVVRRTFILLVALTAPVGQAAAQRQPSRAPTAFSPAAEIPAIALTGPSARPAPWWAPVASAIAPGAGQGALRQQRALGYVSGELFLAVRWLAARRDGADGRSEYRRIARDVARASFGGALRDGPWVYYESMERFLESGRYNAGTAAQFRPEPDETTYNGQQWLLARSTYWRDPDVEPAVSSIEYVRALEFYRGRAVTDEFRWSWTNAQLQQDEYRQRIRRSNASYRQAAEWGGLLLANHLLSTVDAFVSVRLRRFPSTGTAPVGPSSLEGQQVGPSMTWMTVSLPIGGLIR